MMNPLPDRLFDLPQANIPHFCFDESVAAAFSDMAQRSIPGYQTIVDRLGGLAKRLMQPNSYAYDLGCSLGTASLAIYHHLPYPDCTIVAVDSSAAMVSRCQQQVAAIQAQSTIQVVQADITSTNIVQASLVVLNFTLQFLAPIQRLSLLQRIYQGLLPGGVLVLSEKFAFIDPKVHQLLDELHLDFKREHGYSDLAITQKRSALERVMLIDTLETHQKRLHKAGFQHSNLWFQYLNFGSLIAWKL
ncbi:MAG: carboxy-S-adenosyl-L-methionine synthase CmoA [Candidatus Symbiodolus clandestinus]